MESRVTDEMVAALLSTDPADHSNDVYFLFEVNLTSEELEELAERVERANAIGRAEARADLLGYAVH